MNTWIREVELHRGPDTWLRRVIPGDFAGGKVYFDCTEGGVANLVQVYEFDPGSQTIKLIYQSTSGKTLANPDNVVIVPKTGDIFLQEDSDPEHFVRGLTTAPREPGAGKSCKLVSDL
jgi:hypothetical protein